MLDLIIIGAGPTGLYGAFYAALNNLNTLILEIDNEIGGAPRKMFPEKFLYDIPGFLEITGNDFVKNLIEQLETQKNWSIKTNIHITRIEENLNFYRLFDDKNNTYEAKYIIFATGYGSFKFKSLDKSIVKGNTIINHVISNINLYKNKKIVICGGGNSAIDYSLMLSNENTNEIQLIHHSENFRALEENIKKLEHKKNVKIYKGYEIKNIQDNNIEIVKNNDSYKLDFDEIFVFYGIELISNETNKLKIFNDKKKIEVDDNLESIVYKNIFACGSVTNRQLNNLLIHGFSHIAQVIDLIKKRG